MATTDQSYDCVNQLSNRYSSWPKLLRITDLVFKFIKHLGATPENYQSAWSILTKRYKNSRAIINSYLNNFMSLPAIMDETVKDLKSLRDKTSELYKH